jgi:GDPmannose 4,6-dehydratase
LSDPRKAKEKLNWTSKITFDELVAEMIAYDLKTADQKELVKRHRFKSTTHHE